jgi:predicted nucleic acid-binding protein
VITAVDTNILADVFLRDQHNAIASARSLEAAVSTGLVLICDVVYAEFAAFFAEFDDLERFLAQNAIDVEAVSSAALFEAGQTWRRYTRQRGIGLTCSGCGTRSSPACPQCSEPLTTRQHIAADFIVGAHALARADRLLTRDRALFRTYFPELRIDD